MTHSEQSRNERRFYVTSKMDPRLQQLLEYMNKDSPLPITRKTLVEALLTEGLAVMFERYPEAGKALA